MTDRELLELAAKAAGIALKPMQINNVTYQGDDRFIGYMADPEQWLRGWFNPLTDDGDALRLAVRLEMDVSLGLRGAVIEQGHGHKVQDLDDDDPYAAARRAIVRAAAEIGRSD